MKRPAEENVEQLEASLKKEEVKEADQAQQGEEKKQDDTARTPKTRVAIIVGYNGSNFCGSQKNPNVRTVEEELEQSLYRLGAISKFNFGDLKKIGWNRATRTDKKVHALQNVFSCKLHLDKDFEEEEFREKLNKDLPEDVKVFSIFSCSNRFNAKTATSHREYSYYLPSFMLTNMKESYLGTPGLVIGQQQSTKEEVKNEDATSTAAKTGSGIKILRNAVSVEDQDQEDKEHYVSDIYLSRNIDHITPSQVEQLYATRLSQERKDRVEELFNIFLGTKKYHNYSKDIKANQMAAQRFMMKLSCNDFMYVNKNTFEVSNSEDPNAIEFIHFFLKGQAFLYNQIRKMIGCIIQVFRGELDDEFIPNTFRDNAVNVCLAPGDGLMLEKVAYDKYNEVNPNKKSEIMVKRKVQADEIQLFRESLLIHIVKRELENKAFICYMCYFDDYCADYYVKKPGQEDDQKLITLPVSLPEQTA